MRTIVIILCCLIFSAGSVWALQSPSTVPQPIEEDYEPAPTAEKLAIETASLEEELWTEVFEPEEDACYACFEDTIDTGLAWYSACRFVGYSKKRCRRDAYDAMGAYCASHCAPCLFCARL
jgi:hypothetical protein